MNVVVRFFFVEKRGCGCAKCGPDKGLLAFQGIAEELSEKYEDRDLSFEAYNALNVKKFEFLKGLSAPVMVVNDTVISSGKMPVLSDVEAVIKSALE
jgi:hypothetical protein